MAAVVNKHPVTCDKKTGQQNKYTRYKSWHRLTQYACIDFISGSYIILFNLTGCFRITGFQPDYDCFCMCRQFDKISYISCCMPPYSTGVIQSVYFIVFRRNGHMLM